MQAQICTVLILQEKKKDSNSDDRQQNRKQIHYQKWAELINRSGDMDVVWDLCEKKATCKLIMGASLTNLNLKLVL